MGITIHYSGTAKSEKDVASLYKFAIQYAAKRKWRVQLGRPRRLAGIALLPDDDCEPLTLRFTKTRRFSDYCKTQFAGPEVHLDVLQFFQDAARYFSKLAIYDEALDMCEKPDLRSLKKAFSTSLKYIREGQREHPGSKLKVHLPGGRIADLVA
jgi:hypothetical protein